VLVLDDEPLVREMACRFLTRSGYRCIEAGTVDAAIELMRTTEIVAAMFDMRLPHGQTGLDALHNLRQYPALRQIPVLIVTGTILTDAERTAITKQRGFVFQKPEGFSTIVNFLDQLTGRDTSG
jgi:CheY-like chemotaxis protein